MYLYVIVKCLFWLSNQNLDLIIICIYTTIHVCVCLKTFHEISNTNAIDTCRCSNFGFEIIILHVYYTYIAHTCIHCALAVKNIMSV